MPLGASLRLESGRPSHWLFGRGSFLRSRDLLATPFRSGLRSPFPARPICCSAFRLVECLNILADCMTYFALCCSVTSRLLKLISSSYGSQLVSEFFGCGGQTSDAVLAIPVFVCGCAFVHVRLAPSQQPVDKTSQLPGGSEYGNVAAAALRDSSIVRSQGRLAVAQGERCHTQSSRDARTCAVPLFLPYGLASAFRDMRRQGGVGDELLFGGEAAQIGTVFADHDFYCFHPDGIDLRHIHTAHPV